MKDLAQQLFEILDEEIRNIESLYEISREKTNMIACSNTDGIRKIVEKEHEIKLAMDTAEKRRINVVSEIAAFLNISGDITVSDIINKLDDPYKSEVKRRQQDLKKLINDYKENNELNMDLIKSHLSFVDYMVNVMTGQNEESPTYGLNGYSQNNVNNKIYDYKA